MDSLIYLLFISIFVPILLMALLVEKKARLPVLFMLVGIFISVFASEVNGLCYRLLKIDAREMTVTLTPVTEELLKALPILFYATVFSDKRERLFTAAMATGVGFAVLENCYFLIHATNFLLVDAVIRAFGAGLMHGMCTLLVGIGISFVRKKKKLFGVGSFALLTLAITYHSLYNMLIQSDYHTVGAVFPFVTYVPFLLFRIRSRLKQG